MMEKDTLFQGIWPILLATLLLAISFTYPEKGFNYFLKIFGILILILIINSLAKRIFAYNLETDVHIKSWTMNYYWFRKQDHFKKPLTMAWLPIITTLLSKGFFIWLPILEFDIKPMPERVSRRHGLYRFTEVTEWHIALIAVAGIFANIFFGILGYFAGFETFSKLSIYYSLWSLLPFSSLDGTKIFMGSRILWFSLAIILGVVSLWALFIF